METQEITSPPKRRAPRLKLESQCDIRAELTRIYKLAIKGELAWSDASKAANMLQIIGRVIDASEHEASKEALAEIFPPIGRGLKKGLPAR